METGKEAVKRTTFRFYFRINHSDYDYEKSNAALQK